MGPRQHETLQKFLQLQMGLKRIEKKKKTPSLQITLLLGLKSVLLFKRPTMENTKGIV